MTERHPDDDLTPEAAERLFDALAQGREPQGRDGASGADPLTALLSAASAPGRPDELAGEDAAVAAFQSAVAERSSEAVTTRVLPAGAGRPQVGGRGLKRLLTVKAALVALVAASLGGVALAASTGNLPGQTQEHPHPSPRLSPSRHHGGGAGTSGVDPSDPSTPSGTHGPTAPGSPSPTTGQPAEKGKNGKGHQGNPHGQPSKGPKSTPPGKGNGNGNGDGKGKGNGKDKSGGGGDADKQPNGNGSGNGNGNGGGTGGGNGDSPNAPAGKN
ncbi:hypothetical protein AB0J52_16515 [Spirillospora sp. NPDC049652]